MDIAIHMQKQVHASSKLNHDCFFNSTFKYPITVSTAVTSRHLPINNHITPIPQF